MPIRALKAVAKREGGRKRKNRKEEAPGKALELLGILRRPRLFGFTGSGHRAARKARHKKRQRRLKERELARVTRA
jgi:hypothetical protein